MPENTDQPNQGLQPADGSLRKKCAEEISPDLFSDCDSAFVFNEVKKRLLSSKDRSLWQRIEKELDDGGVGAANTYVRSSFTELVQRLRENIDKFKGAMEE